MLLPSVNRALNRAGDFFLKSDLWIFATVMTMISLIITVEDEPYSLLGFLALVGGYAVAFSPVFWFVGLRSHLKSRMKKWRFRGLEAFVFVVYPIVMTLCSVAVAESIDWLNRSYDNALIGAVCVGGSFFTTALILYGLLKSNWLPDVRKRVAGWLSPGVVISVFSVLAAMLFVAGHPDFDKAVHDVNDLLATGIYFGAVVHVLLVYLPFALLFQLHHKFLYRKLLLRRGILYYIMGGVATMLAFAPLHGAYARMFPLTADWELHTSAFRGGAMAPENFALTAGFLVFSIPAVLFLEWVRKTRTIALLEKEKTDTELSLLKQQVNPHFFFNTLNNLYSLSLKQAPETPDTVLQLSELMRYVIYRAREETVELREEVKYLKDYLDLQRIRLYQDADIEFTVDLENPGLKVPPLLFIILVENAFKHGIEPAAGECFLELKLTEHDGVITFSGRNSVEPEAAAKVRSGGIGLQNLHRRLELLFPDAYELEIHEQPEEYSVRLSVWGEAPLSLDTTPLEQLVPEFNEQFILLPDRRDSSVMPQYYRQ